MSVTNGRLTGIARRSARRVPMEELQTAILTIVSGLAGDHKGGRFPRRQITILAAEDWTNAVSELSGLDTDHVLAWTARRANFLVEGLRLPRARGAVLQIGEAVLEVTGQTVPCGRMDEACPGLRAALQPNWRGGITCRVLDGGTVNIGDAVSVLSSPPERVIRLPR